MVTIQRKRFMPVLWRFREPKALNKPRIHPNRKIIEINRLTSQFHSSIQHKPFNNNNDKARVLAFLKAIREVLAIGPSKHRPVNPPQKGTPVDKATYTDNARHIAEIRESLRKGKIEDER